MQDTAQTPQAGTTAGKGPAAHGDFARANALRLAGKLDQAESILNAILRDHPEYVAALMSLGQIQIERNQPGRALPLFLKAIMLCPHDWTILTNLGHLYRMMGATELAARTLDWAAAIGPDDPEIQFARALVLSEQREYWAAIDLLRGVRKAVPGHLDAAYRLGQCCVQVGLEAEAAEAFAAAIASPEFGSFVVGSLSQLSPDRVSLDVLAIADRIENHSASIQDESVRIRLQFARAAILHGRKSYDEAWRILLASNAAMATRLHNLYQRRYQEQKRHLALASGGSMFRDGRSSEDRQGDPVSLFILGPSHSGKSTLERLFDGVPGVKLGYESSIVDYSARQVCQIAGLLSVGQLTDLPSHLDDRFRSFYSQALREKCAGARVFTNTMPDNIVNVGRLHALVPGARFVFLARDSLDIGFRIFQTLYEPLSNSYAYDLQSIRDHLDWYATMTEAWTSRFPDACFNLTYESLVSDPAGSFARVAEFCGIDDASSRAIAVGDDRGCAAPYANRLRPIFGA